MRGIGCQAVIKCFVADKDRTAGLKLLREPWEGALSSGARQEMLQLLVDFVNPGMTPG